MWSIRSPSAGASMCRPVLLSPWRPGTLLTISPNFPLPHASCSFPVAYSDASRCSSFPAWLATALSILPELVPLSSRDTQGLGCSPPPTCLQPTDSPPNTWQSHSRIDLFRRKELKNFQIILASRYGCQTLNKILINNRTGSKK